jgi:hypothetical protein
MDNFDRYNPLSLGDEIDDAQSLEQAEVDGETWSIERVRVGSDYVIVWTHPTAETDMARDFGAHIADPPASRIDVHTQDLKRHWVPQTDAVVAEEVHSQFRGLAPTTIQFRNSVYEITVVRKITGGWLYQLAPWPEGQMLRKVYDYSDLSETIRNTYDRELTSAQEMRNVLMFFRLFVGQLPRGVLEVISARVPLHPAATVKTGAWLAVGFAVFLLVAREIESFYANIDVGSDMQAMPEYWFGPWVTVVSTIFLCDGLLRLALLKSPLGPRGNLLLECLWWFFDRRPEADPTRSS